MTAYQPKILDCGVVNKMGEITVVLVVAVSLCIISALRFSDLS